MADKDKGPQRDFDIDPEFKSFLPALDAEEKKNLARQIENSGKIDDLVVADIAGVERYILIDGHNRLAIAEKLGYAYKYRVEKFQTRDEVLQWMIDQQLGRRNMSDAEKSYYRGKDYLHSKKKQGGKQDANGTSGESTAKRVGRKHKVSASTVQRDAEFAEAVDQLPPEERQEVIKGGSKKKRKEVVRKLREKKGKPVKDKAADNGAPLYDFAKLYSHFTPIAQAADAIAKAYPGEKSSPQYKACQKSASLFITSVKIWQRNIDKKRQTEAIAARKAAEKAEKEAAAAK